MPTPLPADFSFLPFPTLHTERLTLRRITLADAPALFRLRSDAHVMKYVGRPLHTHVSESETMIQNLERMLLENAAINWVITLRPNDTMIGNIGFWQWQKEHYNAEIGYTLDPAYQGKGLMGEAMQAVLQYGKERMHLHTVLARVNPLNAASCKVLERAGFLQEGYQRENYYWNGVFEDTGLWGIVLR
jgi:ribosomal-protein-alanine N-acetyltransferase